MSSDESVTVLWTGSAQAGTDFKFKLTLWHMLEPSTNCYLGLSESELLRSSDIIMMVKVV